MQSTKLCVLGAAVAVLLALGGNRRAGAMQAAAADSRWSIQATLLEACSCPVFCQCFFKSQKPAPHVTHGEHGAAAQYFCRYNQVIRVNKGRFGDVDLGGVTFWRAGDLGDPATREGRWQTFYFEPKTIASQRAALLQMFRGSREDVSATDAAIQWTVTADRAEVRLDRGKLAEVVLQRLVGQDGQPVIIRNLVHGMMPTDSRNTGIVVMPNEVQAYRLGAKAFEFRGTNGFLMTFDSTGAASAGP